MAKDLKFYNTYVPTPKFMFEVLTPNVTISGDKIFRR